jgi:regulation of enolase protein 1 (concanavalin A-like superfamily)
MFAMNSPRFISETKDAIEMEAVGKTDFFIDMMSMKAVDNAPFYYEKRKGDFVIRVKVRPEFKKDYDAGGLFIYDTAKKWIKLEFEMTDLGYPSVVSVVTDGVSDDCNGERQEAAKELWLQIARKGHNWVLHHSDNGKKWKMARYFQLKMKDEVKIGLEVQSPRGAGCTVEFSGLKIADNTLKDMRKGK